MICALKNPGKYLSVSAFAPISNPMQCSWGTKCFTGYFGDDAKELWQKFDSVELIKLGHKFNTKILVDQGDTDNFLSQLLPENLELVCKDYNIDLEFRMQKV